MVSLAQTAEIVIAHAKSAESRRMAKVLKEAGVTVETTSAPLPKALDPSKKTQKSFETTAKWILKIEGSEKPSKKDIAAKVAELREIAANDPYEYANTIRAYRNANRLLYCENNGGTTRFADAIAQYDSVVRNGENLAKRALLETRKKELTARLKQIEEEIKTAGKDKTALEKEAESIKKEIQAGDKAIRDMQDAQNAQLLGEINAQYDAIDEKKGILSGVNEAMNALKAKIADLLAALNFVKKAQK